MGTFTDNGEKGTGMKRRGFLKGAAGAVLAAGFPAIVRARNANGKLCHACIGTGNMAWGDLNSFHSHTGTEIVALCDVDATFLERAHKLVPSARLYSDWRTMLEEEGDRIDSVNVSIPDHNHTIAAVTAMRKGKHVYCQKPLCHEMDECRLIRKTAKETGVVTQLGIQYSAGLGDRLCVEYLRERAIGTIQHVWMFSTRNGISRIRPSLPPASPVPAHLNWDLWIGTAPFRPYAEKVYHPLIWRIWRDFGSGWIGDIGCHLHSAFWQGLNLGETSPLTVRAEVEEAWKTNPERRVQTWPCGAHVTWVYPGNPFTDGKPLTVEWFDGFSDPKANTPPHLLPPPRLTELAKTVGMDALPLEGKVLEGTDGWLILPHTSGPRFVMKNGKPEPEKLQLPKQPSHYHDFLDACIAGRPARGAFDWATWMMEAILIGAIAERVPDTTLQWRPDPATLGNAEADKLFTRAYRDGWKLAGL